MDLTNLQKIADEELNDIFKDALNKKSINPFEAAKIRKAVKEAAKHDIKANAVLVAEDLYRSWFNDGYKDVPVILGYKLMPDEKHELPDDVAFAVMERSYVPDTYEETIAKQAERIKELEDKLYSIRQFMEDELDDRIL
jgi:hypothetical protein